MSFPAATEISPRLLSLDLIRTLVGFDTTSRGSNMALIDWVRDYLAGHGIDSQLTTNDDGRKANLFATLPSRDGNATTGGIVLSGHTDVVPVDGQPWETDPFTATLQGDKLYGRGVADMKSFSAIGLAFVPEFLGRGLSRPLHFALSYDEEVGCIGVRRLIDDISRRGIRPSGCIVGEPTGMRLVIAHKGKRSFRCRVRGREAHSALTPLGVNAVQIACEIVNFLTQIAHRFRDRGGFDAAYDVPYTTVHTGVIHGGTALNIVPRDCTFDFEFRHLPFDDPDALFADVKRFAATLVPEMHAVDPSTYIEFEPISAMPGFDTHGGSQIAELGRACTDERDYAKVSFGTEAALFHNADIATIICGPGHIEQAHQPNEWISLEQLGACERFMRRLGDNVCAA
jgi:acetylornithine deacetylase